MSLRVSVASPLIALALLAPRLADACAAALPDIPTSTTPPSGGELPVNAAIRFDGPTALDLVTLTVDGQPATLEFDYDLPNLGFTVYMRVTPTPSPGQTVVLSGDFCAGYGDPCEATFEYTVVAPDEKPPNPITGLDFGLQRFTESGGAGSCLKSQDAAWHVRWDGVETDPATLHIVELAADDTFSEILDTAVVTASAAPLSARLATLTEGTAGDDHCVRVRTVDLAGNAGPTSDPVCTPQQCRSEGDLSTEEVGFDEPAWTASDRCGEPNGCSITAPTTPAALLLLLPLPLLARRRRR